MVTATAPAIAINDNPTDVLYRADFPQGNTQTVVGVIQFYSLNGTTKVHVDVTGLPKNSGMFTYHIHEHPVGGDCETTGGHFNPYGAPCDCELLGDDSICEIGDLSGKHGLINTTCFELFYYDPYLGLDVSTPQFIGGKSVVIHLESGERLACADIRKSREPEDLLLLNAETEAEEVRKYEELAGIIHRSSHDFQATSVDTEELSETPEYDASTEDDLSSPEDVDEQYEKDDNNRRDDVESDFEAEDDSEEADVAHKGKSGKSTTEETTEHTKETTEELEDKDEDEDEDVEDDEESDIEDVFDDIDKKHPDYSEIPIDNGTIYDNCTNGTKEVTEDDQVSSASSISLGIVISIVSALITAQLC